MTSFGWTKMIIDRDPFTLPLHEIRIEKPLSGVFLIDDYFITADKPQPYFPGLTKIGGTP
jgi:hypothetical protein